MSTTASALAATKAIDRLARDDRGRLLSALIARLKDFSLAEEALQEAMISAVGHWGRSGLPASPEGWLLKVAFRKALDRIRSSKAEARSTSVLSIFAPEEAAETQAEPIPDERLRLIFTCCHPALERKSQVALTLRTLGGLTTGEIARAFLDEEPTMGQRLSRAKAKIAAARIPYAVPDEEHWAERLQSVLAVIYLIFNAGYTQGPSAGHDLAEEAIFLARLLTRLRPEEPEIEGTLALMLLTHARRDARIDTRGLTVSLGDQDRSSWHQGELEEGLRLVETALGRRKAGPYQIKAAIAACHCKGTASDWPQIAALYSVLLTFEPTPVIRLNRAVAMAEAGALEAALAEIEPLSGALSAYQPFHAARAEFLSRAGRTAEAIAAFDEAIRLAENPADAAFLAKRRALSGR